MRSLSNRVTVATAGLLLVVGLLWFGGNLYLSAEAQRVVVVAAAVDIPQGAVITAAMLGSTEVPRGAETDFVTSAEQCLDQVAQVDILAGTVLLPRMLAAEPFPEGRVLPAGTVISPNNLAVAVPLDRLSVAGGALRVGDRVTVYASQPLTSSAALVLPPLAEHVLVLDLFTPEGTSLISAAAGRQADVALLETDPPLADLLMEAARQGGLRLVLEGGIGERGD